LKKLKLSLNPISIFYNDSWQKNNFEIIGSILFYIVGLLVADPIHKKFSSRIKFTP